LITLSFVVFCADGLVIREEDLQEANRAIRDRDKMIFNDLALEGFTILIVNSVVFMM
jgi:hypothetical protein